jgi:DNA replication protein
LRAGFASRAHATQPNDSIEDLDRSRTEERRVRSIQYQMRIAKFPHHNDFATFNYSAATVTKAQIDRFAQSFTDDAHNIILVGRTGTEDAHSIALGYLS